jgi:hypothetical protein
MKIYNPGATVTWDRLADVTLRDYFAGQALIGIMQSWGVTEGREGNVEWAYKYADAMLAERMKIKEAQP